MSPSPSQTDDTLTLKISTILDETKASYATHNRKLKELYNLKSSNPQTFLTCFTKSLLPLFAFFRRTPSAERVVRFVSLFVSSAVLTSHADAPFFEDFVQFLLTAALSANKAPRFRACQITAEIIIRLPDDAEGSDELWDQMIESMMVRVGDKIPIIRTYAVRALARFVNDLENSDILEVFLKMMEVEQIADVRKTIVLSLPPCNATLTVVMGCTLDVSESVRKAAYFVLANKFPLQTLSIKQRTTILQRGLSDRCPAVVKECLKLMKDEWLSKCCNNNPLELLKFLDVETYESIGYSVMRALHESGMVKLDGSERIQKFKEAPCNESGDSDNCKPEIELLEPEAALYWRVVCQNLHNEAQAKGSDAATTMGTEATVYAAEASDKNDLLEKVLPATVADYVDFVQAHIDAGSNYRFVSRQLLLLGTLLDFSDAAIRKIAGAFVQTLLRKPLDYEIDEDENKIVIGDGINLGGDREWAFAVAELIKKVHAADGEFEEVILGVVEELARPCRERTADFMEWMHCLAVIGLLLENTKSFHLLQGKVIEATEVLNSVVLPGSKHLNLDVQRVAVRCLGLYGLLERRPSGVVVNQLGLSCVKGPSQISLLAGKALIDLLMWHGPQEVDKAIDPEILPQAQDKSLHLRSDLPSEHSDVNVGVLNLVYARVDDESSKQSSVTEEGDSLEGALSEGFAKILLLSENYPSIPASLHCLMLGKLISLYFSEESHELQRLKQCLSVFFEHYPSLSANHKKTISKAFVPVMNAMWPGINGNQGGSPAMVSNARKRAVQASRFMIQMMQASIYQKEADIKEDDLPEDHGGTVESSDEFETGQEGLAIRIATEVARYHSTKSAEEKSYFSALCKAMVLLHFRASEQEAVKLARLLLNRVLTSLPYDKELTKELMNMAKTLKELDRTPDEELSRERISVILERLDLKYDFNQDHSSEVPPTPAPRTTRPNRAKRRSKREEISSEEEEESPTSVVPSSAAGPSCTRSQRASKTAALSKITASKTASKAVITCEGISEEEDSDLTSEEESGDSDSSTQ